MDIEAKALELLNAVRIERGFPPSDSIEFDNSHWDMAFYRAIEAHEADKARHAAEMEVFRRKVSQTMHFVDRELERQGFGSATVIRQSIGRFIIPQDELLADNLPFVLKLLRYHETGGHEGDGSDHALREARRELEALATRGLEIVKKEPSQ